MSYGHTATQSSWPAHHDSPAWMSPTALADSQRSADTATLNQRGLRNSTSTRPPQDNTIRNHNNAENALSTFMDMQGGTTVSGGCFLNATGSVSIYNGATSLDSRRNAQMGTDSNTDPTNGCSWMTAITPGPSQNADYDIYHRQLLSKGRGTPLWEPGPDMSLPTEYRRNGVSIGDVGILYRTGDFAFLFNIFLPADHEINRGRVPDGFIPLDKSKLVTKKNVVYGRGSCPASSSVRRTNASEFGFRASGREGAVLVMPDGALTEDLRKYKLVEKYVAENAKGWYEYVESDDCGMQTENGDIRVVVGMDKASSWGMATFKNVNSEDPLRFEFKNDGRGSQAATPYRWDGILTGRAGPSDEEVQDLQASNMSPLRNQSVFIRTLNISVSGKVRDELAVHEIRSSSFRDDIPDSSGHQPQPGQRNVNIQSESQIGQTLPHPSNVLNNYLLEKCPNAKVIITKDSDWMSVITQNDSTSTFEDICARVLASHTICEKKGVVTLKKRKISFSTGFTSDPSAITIAGHRQTASEDLTNDRETYVIGRLFLEARDDRAPSDPPDILSNTLMEKREHDEWPHSLLLSITGESPRYSFSNSPMVCNSPMNTYDNISKSALTDSSFYMPLASDPNPFLPALTQDAEYDVHHHYLHDKGRGTPRWAPGPSTDYAQHNVNTDDVGSPIDFPDHFDVPFTEYLPPAHKMDEGGPLNNLIPLGETKVENRLVKGCSSSFYRQWGPVAFGASAAGAVLVKPDGAFSEKLQHRNLMGDYIAGCRTKMSGWRPPSSLRRKWKLAQPLSDSRDDWSRRDAPACWHVLATPVLSLPNNYPNHLPSLPTLPTFMDLKPPGIPRLVPSLLPDVHTSPYEYYRSLRLHNFLRKSRDRWTHDEESVYSKHFSANHSPTHASDNIVRHWDMHGTASLLADCTFRSNCTFLSDCTFRSDRWRSVVSSPDGSRILPTNRGVSTIWDVRTGQSTTTGKPYSYRDLTNQFTFTPRPMDFVAHQYSRENRLGDVGDSLEASRFWPISESENSGSELAVLTGVLLSMSSCPSAKSWRCSRLHYDNCLSHAQNPGLFPVHPRRPTPAYPI